MSRIRIDDLPVTENLTPEQEALIQGAGLKSFRPSLEALEDRQLMTAGITFDAATRVLTIQGDDRANQAQVKIVDGQVKATMTTQGKEEVWQRDASAVAKIVFRGEGGNDSFTNETAIPAEAHGGNGNDKLQVMTLQGQELHGGDGADRFLVPHGSTAAKDAKAEDVVLAFKKGDKDWTAAEIEVLDKSFALLHEATGKTDLLKHDGNGLVIERVGRLRGRSGTAINWGENHGHGLIKISDAGLSNHETFQIANAAHEIGHNWDAAETNPKLWTRFLEQSGWTDSIPGTKLNVGEGGSVNVEGPGGYLRRFQSNDRGGYDALDVTSRTLTRRSAGGYRLTELSGESTVYDANGNLIGYTKLDANNNLISYTISRDKRWAYRSDAKFVSEYARTNPREDFAESFTAYFLKQAGRNWSDYRPNEGTGAAAIPEKINLIGGWVTDLKTRS